MNTIGGFRTILRIFQEHVAAEDLEVVKQIPLNMNLIRFKRNWRKPKRHKLTPLFSSSKIKNILVEVIREQIEVTREESHALVTHYLCARFAFSIEFNSLTYKNRSKVYLPFLVLRF